MNSEYPRLRQRLKDSKQATKVGRGRKLSSPARGHRVTTARATPTKPPFKRINTVCSARPQVSEAYRALFRLRPIQYSALCGNQHGARISKSLLHFVPPAKRIEFSAVRIFALEDKKILTINSQPDVIGSLPPSSPLRHTISSCTVLRNRSAYGYLTPGEKTMTAATSDVHSPPRHEFVAEHFPHFTPTPHAGLAKHQPTWRSSSGCGARLVRLRCTGKP